MSEIGHFLQAISAVSASLPLRASEAETAERSDGFVIPP